MAAEAAEASRRPSLLEEARSARSVPATVTTMMSTAVEEEVGTDDVSRQPARAVVAAAAAARRVPDSQSSLPRPAMKPHHQ